MLFQSFYTALPTKTHQPECVTLCNRLTYVLWQRWEFINVFTGVLAAGHAKAKLKVETLEQLFSKIMSLYHPEVFYGLISDCELHTEKQKRKGVWDLQCIWKTAHQVHDPMKTEASAFSLTLHQLVAVEGKTGWTGNGQIGRRLGRYPSSHLF